MSGFVNFEDAEKKAVRMATNDGLWEILLGLMLLSFTASAVLHDIWGVPWNYIPLILVMVTGIPLMRAAKKSLIMPRIGQVEFSQGRKTKFKKVNAFLIVLVVLTWIVFLGPVISTSIVQEASLPYWFVDAVFGLLIFIFFVVLSYAFETPRMIIYGLLFGISLPADIILNEKWGIEFPVFNFIAGLVVVTWGVVTLIRFLKRYPLPDEQVRTQIERGTNG